KKNGEPTFANEHQPYLVTQPLRSPGGGLLAQGLSWPAVLLFGPDQWPSFSTNTKGFPLYRAFGGWRQVLAEPPAPDPFAPFPPARRALAAHNRRKATAARTQYEGLLRVATGLWPKVLGMGTTGRGRPACKRRLRGLLAEQGVEVTRRQLDALMADLKRMAAPLGS